MKNKPIIILGTTATGKSTLGIELAGKYNGEIISLDSMQIYIGMDIGTAKPTREELELIPHHMINCQPLCESSDVAAFIAQAKKCENEIVERKSWPVFVGGTAMYIKTYVDGLFVGPKSSPAIRNESADHCWIE